MVSMVGYLALSFSYLYNKAGAIIEATFFIVRVRVFYRVQIRRWITPEDNLGLECDQKPPFCKPSLRLDGDWSLKYCPLLRLLPILFILTSTESTQFPFYSGLHHWGSNNSTSVVSLGKMIFSFACSKEYFPISLFFSTTCKYSTRINMNMIALTWAFKSENRCSNISRGNSRRTWHYINILKKLRCTVYVTNISMIREIFVTQYNYFV